jgi:hydrogenase maturation protease
VRTRVIAIGQRSAGDDGVGPAVLDHLTRSAGHTGPRDAAPGEPPGPGDSAESLEGANVRRGVDFFEADDAVDLISLLQCSGAVILIDAFVGEDPPGTVREISGEINDEEPKALLSSHGMGVRLAIALARTLSPEQVTASIRIVGISIALPTGHSPGLSPAVARAVPVAAGTVMSVLGD